MTVRAKMRLSHRTDRQYSEEGAVVSTLRFDAVYDQNSPEDRRFQKATPSAHAEFQIDNPAALAQFEIGQNYYVDFTPAED